MEIRKYIALLLRWSWLIILVTVICATIAYVLSINTPPQFESRTRLLIDEAPGGTSSNNEYAQLLLEQQLTGTYMELIQARPIFEKTIAELDLATSPEVLARRVTVSAPGEGKIIDISVRDFGPNAAAQTANTLAEVFIEDNTERQSQRYVESIENRQETLSALLTNIEDLETQINELADSTDPADLSLQSRLDTQLRELQISYTQGFNDLEALRVEQARDLNNLIVVEPAIPDPIPVTPRILRDTVLAAALGAFLAIGFVFLLDFLDDTVKSPDDIVADTGYAVLGVIAEIEGKQPGDKLATLITPRAPVSEAFRALRTNLNYASLDTGLTTFLITSASPGEGKSTVAANLAIVIAQNGLSVILVDADLRLPTQHNIFELNNSSGLMDAILNIDSPLSDYLQSSPVENLRVLTSGQLPPNPAELLNSQRMQQVIHGLKKEADVVVFDTPPALTVTDAAVLSVKVDGCILVGEVGRTNRSAIIRAIESMTRSQDAHLFGIVLNKLQLRRLQYYDHAYHYHYYAYDYSKAGKKAHRRSRLPAWLAGIFSRL